MSDEREYTMRDLLAASYEQKPLEFKAAFDALIADRLVQAVDNRKVEVAQTMYSSAEVEQEPEPEEEPVEKPVGEPEEPEVDGADA